MLKHKQALYEIFDAEMQSGQVLEDVCEKILLSAGQALPGDVNEFITLGGFAITDIPTGALKDKYVTLMQTIVCGSTVRDEEEAESKAEDRVYLLSRLVRTILKNNQTLVSTTYPDGAAKRSFLSDAFLDTVVYSDSPAVIISITLGVRVQEED